MLNVNWYEYVIRGKRVEIEELEGVVAVKPKEREAAREDVYRAFGEIAETRVSERVYIAQIESLRTCGT